MSERDLSSRFIDLFEENKMKRCVQRFAGACFETRARAPLVYALLLVVCAGPAMAQGVRYNDVARTKDNRPLSNGTVAVCVANPTDPGNVGSRHTTPPAPCASLGALSNRSLGLLGSVTVTKRTQSFLPLGWTRMAVQHAALLTVRCVPTAKPLPIHGEATPMLLINELL